MANYIYPLTRQTGNTSTFLDWSYTSTHLVEKCRLQLFRLEIQGSASVAILQYTYIHVHVHVRARQTLVHHAPVTTVLL